MREGDESLSPGTASVIPTTKTQAAVPNETLAHDDERKPLLWVMHLIIRSDLANCCVSFTQEWPQWNGRYLCAARVGRRSPKVWLREASVMITA